MYTLSKLSDQKHIISCAAEGHLIKSTDMLNTNIEQVIEWTSELWSKVKYIYEVTPVYIIPCSIAYIFRDTSKAFDYKLP